MIFTIGAAKGIARARWRREHGDRVPSEEEIKQFVFTFLARWRGDEGHRYAVLARWAYESLRDAKKDLERATTNQRRAEMARPDIVLSPELDETRANLALDWDDDAEFALPHCPSQPAPGAVKRFILLNPPQQPRKVGKKLNNG